MADIKEILVQWDAGADLSAIARALGYSRPTVRKYVRAAAQVGLTPGQRRRDEATWDRLTAAAINQVATQRPPGAVTGDVSRYHAYLDLHIGAVHLTTLHQRLCAEQGLRASWGTFYRYVRATWPDRMVRTPQATVRLDDPPPGSEAQVDFFYVGRWFDPEAGRERKLYGFLMTLSHSRHSFLYPVLAEDSAAWLAGHIEAFTFFGAVPKRIVPDNLSAGILKADRYDPRLNRAYGELARYYACTIDPSRVAHPKDKPRVERTVPYARDSFFAGRTFASLAQMRADARCWVLEVAGTRTHGTTREQPLVAFQVREQPAMLALPPTPWEPVAWLRAKLRHDCHLVALRAEYSAPHRYIGQDLDVRVGRTMVHIYAGAELLTTHVRKERGRSTRLEHYPAAGQAFLRQGPRVCVEQARAIGPAATTLVQGLLITETTHQLREAQAVLRLVQRYPAERLDQACALALASGNGRLRTVRGLLDQAITSLEPPADAPPTPTSGAFLRGPATFAGYVAEVPG